MVDLVYPSGLLSNLSSALACGAVRHQMATKKITQPAQHTEVRVVQGAMKPLYRLDAGRDPNSQGGVRVGARGVWGSRIRCRSTRGVISLIGFRVDLKRAEATPPSPT